MKGGLGNIMKQAQAMQENMKKAQDELADIDVEGQSGGGLVSITMSCKHDVRRLKIDPALVDDVEVLEDLVAAAFNDALKKVETTTQDKMGGLTAGMNLPGGMKLPF
ncbi:MAG: YbaB/EbfC family nucleoid-associated protein [Arenicellales bacterium]